VNSFQGKEPEYIREKIRDFGRKVKAECPPGWGYTVLMFDYNTEDGSMVYFSSANREDMIKALKEFIEKAGG
jgi:hypothetical protein